MGYKHENINKRSYQQKGKSYKNNLQSYYTNMYDTIVKQLKQQGHQLSSINTILSSIFSRTKLPTKTINSQLLKLIDIDKIISFNERSLKENSDQIKHMRMVASLKHHNNQETSNTNGDDNGFRQINNLVRMARLHFMQNNQPQGDDSSEEETEQVRQIHQTRIDRLRQTLHTRYDHQ